MRFPHRTCCTSHALILKVFQELLCAAHTPINASLHLMPGPNMAALFGLSVVQQRL